ncbi:HAD family hydrolase [Pseudonocardia lacus]|uniref:HAD family hydrolase n=1 Tax=Pseudonocardia lacus TaxID=2835865 RepID=UPI0027E38671|nr:HAD-IA family hydrolase [Pseudonocardia lacus]
MPAPLIIDLDGVLRRWEPLDAVEARHGLPRGALLAAAFEPDLLHRAITGAVDDDRWRADVTAALAAAHGPAARAAVAEWSASSGAVDAEVLELVRRYRRRAPVVALTNATSRLPRDLAAVGLDRELDRVFSSHELGVAKPDPRVFALVCARLDRAPAECLFVDDTEGHVAAAREAGLRAHHYHSPAALAAFLDHA